MTVQPNAQSQGSTGEAFPGSNLPGHSRSAMWGKRTWLLQAMVRNAGVSSSR